MLDESTLRKPGFSEGAAVVLGDGREWRLPKPRLVFFPTREPGGRYATRIRLSYGREADALFAEAFGLEDDEGDNEGVIAAKMNLVCLLLSSNYDIDGDGLMELLEIRTDEPEAIAWWMALNEAVMSQVQLGGIAPPVVATDK